MLTVKQISQLSGVSVRTLHYYDEIGLFKPSRIAESGYRLYHENSLDILQQVLFYKELGFKLNDIKKIMLSETYDKHKAFVQQRALMSLKRDRINSLLELLDKLISGEKVMSFNQFDMSEYFSLLKAFRENHSSEVIAYWGSLSEFDNMTDRFMENEKIIAETAIEYYGSIENYTAAMEKNLSELPDKIQAIKKEVPNIHSTQELLAELVSDLNRDVCSNEIQANVDMWVKASNEQMLNTLDNNYWNLIKNAYLQNSEIIKNTDEMYGKGASDFIGRALNVYLEKQ